MQTGRSAGSHDVTPIDRASPHSAPEPTLAAPAPTLTMSAYQKLVVVLLAFLQFTVVLDFMILSPLGAILMPALHITPAQFGVVVSAYAFSAGASGVLAAGFADRFDRKKLLLFFYTGFLLGTLFCGLATSYPLLLAARMVAGLFGGVLGSVVFAITTDLFPLAMRGRVMGFVQTAFSTSQILGIPAGLYLSGRWGWHAPFFMIVAVGVLVGVVIARHLRPIDAHLAAQHDAGGAFAHVRATLGEPRYLQAFATTALLATGGFMLLPFGSAFSVHNLGVPVDKLPHVYLITGLCAMVIGPLVGRITDRFGKWNTFVFGSVLSIVMVLVYTNLGLSSLGVVIVVNAVMFIGISARMIPSQALMSAIPSLDRRGSFMAIGASVQQLSGGVAAVLAGMIVAEGPGGVLLHFEQLGYVVVAASLFTLFMMNRIRRVVPE